MPHSLASPRPPRTRFPHPCLPRPPLLHARPLGRARGLLIAAGCLACRARSSSWCGAAAAPPRIRATC
eukprot:6189862-Prymnesium_polylepis.3